jgi:hypothetical protein
MSKRRSLMTMVAAVVVMLGLGLAATPAQAASFTQVNVWNSSHCLDNATENSLKLQMWNCTGGSEQHWRRAFNGATGGYTFINQRSGNCMIAPMFSPGTIWATGACDTSDRSQNWKVYAADNPGTGGSYFVWQNMASLLCLTTPSVGNGTLPQTATCDPSDQYDRWHEQ